MREKEVKSNELKVLDARLALPKFTFLFRVFFSLWSVGDVR
jgi:hypothetical protein